jgi:hypothetical protein
MNAEDLMEAQNQFLAWMGGEGKMDGVPISESKSNGYQNAPVDQGI